MSDKFTMHVDVDAFLPATEEEKEYMVQMRPSSTFFRDGVKRLLKNRVATVSLIVIVVIAALALLIGLLFRRHRQQQVKQAARQAQLAARGQEHAEGPEPDHPAHGVRPRNEEIKEESV